MRITNRREFLRVGLGGTTVAIGGTAGCLGLFDSDPVKKTNTVKLTKNGFKPKNIKQDTAGEVIWENTSSVEHTVTSASDNWDFDITVQDDQFVKNKFQEDGVYKAVCKIHGSVEDFTGERMKMALGSGVTIEDPVE